MKTVAEEQLPILGDQIEVGGNPPYRTAAAQQHSSRARAAQAAFPSSPRAPSRFLGIGDPVLIHSPWP